MKLLSLFFAFLISTPSFSGEGEKPKRLTTICIDEIPLRLAISKEGIPIGEIRSEFIGLYDEESERALSLYLNPLINKEDPFTIRITSLDLVHQTYLGR